MGVIVVKLGGSVITRKRETLTLRRKVLTRLSAELNEGWERAGRPGLVVIHGAGSFGHPFAKKWGLAEAPPGPRGERNRGVAVTSMNVRILHNHVLRALVDAGLPAVSVPPSLTSHNREGKLEEFSMDPFTVRLMAGLVPVTFGDVVPDIAWGSSILSGDRIALELASKMPVERAIFVCNVDGVLDGSNPPSVIRTLTEDTTTVLKPLSPGPDVTGGIRGKAERMVEMGKLGVRTGLINGLSAGRLAMALRGVETSGTWT